MSATPARVERAPPERSTASVERARCPSHLHPQWTSADRTSPPRDRIGRDVRSGRARARRRTYVASFHSVSAGAPLAIAIAIHNIPEGLAVTMQSPITR